MGQAAVPHRRTAQRRHVGPARRLRPGPTLAATEALLAELGEPAREGPARGELLASATAGLRALRRWLGAGPAVPVPDTIGVETLGSWLLGEINGLLAGLAIDPWPAWTRGPA